MMRTRSIFAALLAGTTLFPALPATAISGGQEVNSDYIVQIVTRRADGENDRCTGSALNSKWIITAAHCIEDAESGTSSQIYFSNNKLEPGEAITSSSIVESPEADLALIELSTEHELPTYAVLASDHRFTHLEHGYIYGYGRGIGGKTMPWLRRAEVEQSHEGRDSYWNDTYRLNGVDGTSNHGDSGGPFMVKDKLVGINVVGSHVADSYWIGENSGALQLRPFVPWIEKITGAKALPFTSAAEPSEKPSTAPIPAPSTSPEPSLEPTSEPSARPSTEPSTEPSAEPTLEPTSEPSQSLKLTPTPSATSVPSASATNSPIAPPSPTATAKENMPSARPTSPSSTDPSADSSQEPVFPPAQLSASPTSAKTSAINPQAQNSQQAEEKTTTVAESVSATHTPQASLKTTKLAYTGGLFTPIAGGGVLLLLAGILLRVKGRNT